MAEILQLTGGAEQNPMNSLDYNSAALGSLTAYTNATTNVVSTAQLSAGANLVIAIQVQPDAFYIRPLMQWTVNTYQWFTQYEQDPGQLTAPNGYYPTFLAYYRQNPGGGADPGSGKVVQLDVPTFSGQNPMAQVLPFPSIAVGA
jgi:hypothetical protein